MGKKDDDKAAEKARKAQEKLEKEQNARKAAKLGKVPGTKDAYCTECHNWYDSTNQGEVNKHAH